MSPKYVKRITLFKIPKEEDIDAIISEYEVLRATAQKVAPLIRPYLFVFGIREAGIDEVGLNGV